MRRNLVEPIAVLVRNSYRFLPALREYPVQRRLGRFELRPWDFFELPIPGCVFSMNASLPR
jgi:hypothetical protein